MGRAHDDGREQDDCAWAGHMMIMLSSPPRADGHVTTLQKQGDFARVNSTMTGIMAD